MAPWNHGETDTRVFLHATEMTFKGNSKVIINTVDTDVLILAISDSAKLQSQTEEFFWCRQNKMFYPANIMILENPNF